MDHTANPTFVRKGPVSAERRKLVHVRAYDRVRLGRPEYVRAHFRSRPHQYAFHF